MMLETEEVDIDYFTPAESTSLASIFGKSSVTGETKENPSLKYVPPPPPDKAKSEETKPTQLIFTCAIHGFEWINSRYVNRGKLGLVILKMVTDPSPSIILYDSNKKTVSCVTISPKLNIHIRDVSTISYYDNAQKYWSIKTSDEDLNKILQLVKDFQATIVPKSVEETDKEQPGNSKVEKKEDVIKDEEHKEEHGTDTDFYMTQKTKDSIIKRMANMGHSVLPQNDNTKGCPSDSSDSNDNERKRNIKHKPRIPPKKCTDLTTEQGESNIACHSTKSTHRIHMDKQSSGQSKSITTPILYDTNVFFSEQKISNSELRINVNRVSDKLDVVLTKLNDVINTDKSNSVSNFQNDVVQKLIKEYESKINYYEYVMNSKGIDYNTVKLPDKTELNETVSDRGLGEYMKKIDEVQSVCKEKDNIIRSLEEEIRICNEKSIKTSEDDKEKIDGLVMEIKSLTENLHVKNEEINVIKNNLNSTNSGKQETCDIANKVKKIMNDTFEAISVNFDDTEAYSGERIKAIVAKVIKKTTIKALDEL